MLLKPTPSVFLLYIAAANPCSPHLPGWVNVNAEVSQSLLLPEIFEAAGEYVEFIRSELPID